MTLMIDTRTWVAPGPEGPWAESPNSYPKVPVAFLKAARDQVASNDGDVACLGMVQHEGETHRVIQFVTQSDPNPDQGGSYFGSTNTVYSDPETNLMTRHEQCSQFAHSRPEPGTDWTISVYSNDPTIRLEEPQGG